MTEVRDVASQEPRAPEPIQNDRRDFLKGALVASGVAASAAAGVVTAYAQGTQPGRVPGTTNHYFVPATDKTVHWGYFSKSLPPLVGSHPTIS